MNDCFITRGDKVLRVLIFLVFSIIITACSGNGSSSTPTISIENPTSEPTYSTNSTSIRIGGRISRASFVHIQNTTTGFSTEGYVFYNNEGIGTWFSDVYGLIPGDNLITATADSDGSGTNTAVDSITISRPLQPYTLIINAADSTSATNYWTDMHSISASHSIALFADGTGISTTGNVLSEDAGATITFTWSVLGTEAIQIDNCPSCSFQQITRISGSLDEGVFLGQVETVNGDGETALHAFFLNSGTL